LAEKLFGSSLEGELIADELSQQRRFRLKRVLHEYLPPPVLERIKIQGYPGDNYAQRQRERFDRVLADVPCSSEKHVYLDPKEFKKWTPSRSKNLVRRQYSLICSAWDALKPGGKLVYSTCSLNPHENDDVIGKLIARQEKQSE